MGRQPFTQISGRMRATLRARPAACVASTTALVRHNLAPDAWVSGISAFTIVFAVGQVLGPVLVGWISDGPGGLQRGFLASALALWLGALLASRQKALTGH